MFKILCRKFGSRPLKKRNNPIAIHASQRPEDPLPASFKELGLKYEPTVVPEIVVSSTTWAPPPKSIPDLPFVVERTVVGSSIPVYTDYKAGGTKVVTILRRCKGDITILKSEMEKVVGKKVDIKPGKLVVDGNFSKRLKVWLLSLGF
jgi:large subunit ribosomal protein L49